MAILNSLSKPPMPLRYAPWRVLLMCAALLGAMLCASLMFGAKPISMSTVVDSLMHHRIQSDDALIVREARVPRTLLGLLAGLALGLSGVLMQALTRNPLADPGILGVNAGASFAVVIGVAFWGVTSGQGLLVFAFVGALSTTLLVYLIGAQGSARLDPARFVLGGFALGAVMTGLSTGITLLDPAVFDRMRFWSAGSLDVRDLARVLFVAPVILVGAVLALGLGSSLNTLSMGDELAISLGSRPALIRSLSILAITLLCSASTALTGPISFIGLMIPHWARRWVGSDLRWLLPCSALLAPILLLAADIIGRLLVPGELRVSIVTAFIGAPMLIWLARQHQALRRA